MIFRRQYDNSLYPLSAFSLNDIPQHISRAMSETARLYGAAIRGGVAFALLIGNYYHVLKDLDMIVSTNNYDSIACMLSCVADDVYLNRNYIDEPVITAFWRNHDRFYKLDVLITDNLPKTSIIYSQPFSEGVKTVSAGYLLINKLEKIAEKFSRRHTDKKTLHHYLVAKSLAEFMLQSEIRLDKCEMRKVDTVRTDVSTVLEKLSEGYNDIDASKFNGLLSDLTEQNVNKLLVCQLRNYGDIIRTFPIIDAIKHRNPNVFIGYVCFEDMCNVAELDCNIDAIHTVERLFPVKDSVDNTRLLDISCLEKTISRIKDRQYDVYIDFHGVFQSALIGMLCEIPRRISRSRQTTEDGAHLFYTEFAVVLEREINRMERHMRVAKTVFPSLEPPHITVLETNDVLVCPGSSKKGFLKRWPVERYRQLIELVVKNFDRHVTILLGPDEVELVACFEDLSNTEVILTESWAEICRLIRRAAVVIGSDSAYIHIAVWVGKYAVPIIGPSSPVINGVWGYGPGVTVCANVCVCKDMWQGVCDRNHICMKSILVEDVYNMVCSYWRAEHGENKE
ncbi:hypothetical protein FACS1894187_18210 [Synergistales bacterium]|nr:hypothetical protein FACS1894187_18210 [Synergistales bacterium]